MELRTVCRLQAMGTAITFVALGWCGERQRISRSVILDLAFLVWPVLQG